MTVFFYRVIHIIYSWLWRGSFFYGDQFSTRLTWRKMTSMSFFFKIIQLLYSLGSFVYVEKWPLVIVLRGSFFFFTPADSSVLVPWLTAKPEAQLKKDSHLICNYFYALYWYIYWQCAMISYFVIFILLHSMFDLILWDYCIQIVIVHVCNHGCFISKWLHVTTFEYVNDLFRIGMCLV